MLGTRISEPIVVHDGHSPCIFNAMYVLSNTSQCVNLHPNADLRNLLADTCYVSCSEGHAVLPAGVVSFADLIIHAEPQISTLTPRDYV